MTGTPSMRLLNSPYRRQIQVAFVLSWIVNWALMAGKVWAFVVTHSQAVLASMVDSGVDLASQWVISMSEALIRTPSPAYPVGRARLEALGVIACACIMSIASIEVIQSASGVLYQGLAHHEIPSLDLSAIMYGILVACTALKLLLWLYCVRLKGRSDSVAALAEDHINDVMSNAAALVAAVLADRFPRAWWVDAGGAIFISFWIIVRWSFVVNEQVGKLVGKSAPAEFNERCSVALPNDSRRWAFYRSLDFSCRLEAIAANHHPEILVDVIRAYHFGARWANDITCSRSFFAWIPAAV